MNIMEEAKNVFIQIWTTIVSWFQEFTGWLDPLLKPTTNTWWQGIYDLFLGFPVLLQIVLVGFGMLLIVMGLLSLIKKSMKLVITVGVIVLIFFVLNN